MEQQSPKPNIYQKMADVMGIIERLPKRGRNEHFEYDYVLDSDVLDALRKAMAYVGLAFLPAIEPSSINREGSKTTLTLTMLLADTETGETVTASWPAEAIDKQDKGINKAITSGIKYFLLKTFLVSTGDEVDPDSESPAISAAKKTAMFDPARIKNFNELYQAAVQHLEYYDHPEHVRNTLKKITDGDKSKLEGKSWTEVWRMLVEYRDGKKSADLDAQAAAESGDEPSGETMQFDLDAIPT